MVLFAARIESMPHGFGLPGSGVRHPPEAQCGCAQTGRLILGRSLARARSKETIVAEPQGRFQFLPSS